MSQAITGITIWPLDKRVPFGALGALVSMSIARQLRTRRVIVMVVLFCLPSLFAGLTRYYNPAFNPAQAEYVLIFNLIPHALIPLAALLYASGMIQDEIEDQTLTYLMVRPLPRWGIYVAKYLSTLFVTVLLTTLFTFLTYLTINIGLPEFWSERVFQRAAITSGIFALGLLAYVSIFGALSLLVKRTLVVGVTYIIFFESVVANIDFIVRKATVMYYLRVLSMRWLDLRGAEWTIRLDTAASATECVLTLVIASTVITTLAAIYFGVREFRVKTPEGS